MSAEYDAAAEVRDAVAGLTAEVVSLAKQLPELTLRDLFAGRFAAAVIAGGEIEVETAGDGDNTRRPVLFLGLDGRLSLGLPGTDRDAAADVARLAYELADAMLTARGQNGGAR